MDEFKKIIGAKVVHADLNLIVVEKDGEKFVITPYCACHSGFWGLGIDPITPETIKNFSCLVLSRLRELNII